MPSAALWLIFSALRLWNLIVVTSRSIVDCISIIAAYKPFAAAPLLTQFATIFQTASIFTRLAMKPFVQYIIVPLFSTKKCRLLRWAGHVTHMPFARDPRNFSRLVEKPLPFKCPLSGPAALWRMNYKAKISFASFVNKRGIAADRNEWREDSDLKGRAEATSNKDLQIWQLGWASTRRCTFWLLP